MKVFESRFVLAGILFSTFLLFFAANTASANVYATDIRLNGSLSSISNAPLTPVTITYHLNENATAGVQVNILLNNTLIATISGGTNMGLNTVAWGGTNNLGAAVGSGAYSVSITAAATGFPVWTQTSLDSTNNVAVYPEGIAVDNNTNSPYYGRILMGCANPGTVHGVSQLCGIYKMNADGTAPADEGAFGYGGYTTNDAGGTSSGEMNNGQGYNPWRLRMGEDDRLYMDDYSAFGAIVAFDVKVTTNQIVINEAGYSGNPDFHNFQDGINNFDVTGTTTSNAAVWLCDQDLQYNWGIWMFHLKKGVADPADTVGTQAVIQSSASDLSEGSSGGCMIDNNLDIFVSQYAFDNIAGLRTMDYTNWNYGVLPPEAGNAAYALTNQILWGAGSSDITFEAVEDTVIDSRRHPTMVALPMYAGDDNYPGIRVLNATNGSVITVTNGATVQVLTNLDYPNQYTCAAWDNVGNLYGGCYSLNYWRVWSPPGANTNTTVAVAQINVSAPSTPPNITGITINGSNVVIQFTAGATDLPAAFTLISATAVYGSYTPVAGAMITGGSGAYQATAPMNGSTRFYRLER